MGKLDHLTWLLAKMVSKSPDPRQNGGSHVLYKKAIIFELKVFKPNKRDLKA